MPIAEVVGFGAAMDYVSAVGVEAIADYESELAAYALERLAEVGGVIRTGLRQSVRAGIVSFNVEGIHPHDVAHVLDSRASRSGPATTAASR